MNHYTELLAHIKQLAESDPLVESVTQGLFTALDEEKSTIYPLVHVQVNGGSLTNGQVVEFDIQVGAFQQRKDYPVADDAIRDKFYDSSNEVDNMNETLGILNRLWTAMFRDYNYVNIQASESPSLTPMYETGTNVLDGWILTFNVTLPNTTINLCNI